MNRVIAGAFASILSLIHGIVLIGLGLLTIMFFSDDKRQITQFSNMVGVSPEAFILVIIAIWIGYVLVMGILATFIAMNENLERLQTTLERISAKLPN